MASLPASMWGCCYSLESSYSLLHKMINWTIRTVDLGLLKTNNYWCRFFLSISSAAWWVIFVSRSRLYYFWKFISYYTVSNVPILKRKKIFLLTKTFSMYIWIYNNNQIDVDRMFHIEVASWELSRLVPVPFKMFSSFLWYSILSSSARILRTVWAAASENLMGPYCEKEKGNWGGVNNNEVGLNGQSQFRELFLRRCYLHQNLMQ